ncbi:neuronal acetylcholine receptor subunit alpha-6 [Elysia marginata]|uniref:Neuronal acetylcholine receptor subunit alpha-6 n=1 Tax=Elysia marginata TaxID=1093978 RepID=A0AAV4FE26_9GAST|nr:neuronal acetylcholine receptor subunit alpha-6 [Elysia marginata]
MAPKLTSVFRPQLIMLNTMEDRDLFKDDYAPLSVFSDGAVTWAPGSIFPASCKLDLTKYPFDQQDCRILMLSMNYNVSEMEFVVSDSTVGQTFFTQNGQWDISNMSIETLARSIGAEAKSAIVINFRVTRKPTFLVISMLLPIAFLSLLNLMVFVIPVDSGEKISYGITVLLALSVFMSIMSSMLPSSSESMPLMISYIFILMIISVLTVVDSIIIVGLHHMEEEEEKSLKAKANFKALLPKIKLFRKAVSPLTHSSEGLMNQHTAQPGVKPFNAEDEETQEKSKLSLPNFPGLDTNSEPAVNNYKLIGKHIDMVSLIVFGVIWLSVTIGFMAAITA